MNERVGTIIHGALGDCYEQLLCLEMYKKGKTIKVIGFFASEDRLNAMKHFALDMLDEVHLISEIVKVDVDHFHQYQINDIELKELVLDHLSDKLLAKFDFSNNIKPWTELRNHDFRKSGLALELSAAGKKYLPVCVKNNGIDFSIFEQEFTVGFLWRYRHGGAIKPYFQRPQEWILKTKTELFERLIQRYNAHIFICGMAKEEKISSQISHVENAGFVVGEYLSKVSENRFDLPVSNCTYLKGLGYAAEMTIMSHCNLLLMMPSGFSEPLWMMRKSPVVMLDPPPMYVAKLFWNRMPLFDNKIFASKIFNSIMPHTAENVLHYLERRGFIPK